MTPPLFRAVTFVAGARVNLPLFHKEYFKGIKFRVDAVAADVSVSTTCSLLASNVVTAAQ